MKDSSPFVLRYEDVNIRYKEKKIVNNISFTVKPGEVLGIVGESGSGKSTIIKAAMGLLGPGGMVSEGRIWFHGKDMTKISSRDRKKLCGKDMGMIFQDSQASLCPIRTVGAQIHESLAAHGRISRRESRKKAEELFARIGIADGERIMDSYPFELSGGMNQRVGIVMAMLMNPSLLFADEPTSALDVIVQKQVVEEMMQMQKASSTAIILVTHNMGVVRAMADHVLVLKEGEAVEYGTVKDIIEYPKEEYTRNLMEAVPVLKRRPRVSA